MVFATMEAGVRRRRREHNERVHLAYEIVKITRENKPKPLTHYQIPIDPPTNVVPAWKAQRDAERRALAMSRKKKRRA